ncbi:hypothetical protein K4C25_004327 [Escherichia coli]|nr:hypothetical protein [Escherichia coli]EFC7942879.1 hypothetical protein [Escherichia coli]EHW2839859.1 hypothetical protein [Escherichia coli]EHY3276253.1 hypothetical protein [Escherichia coli]
MLKVKRPCTTEQFKGNGFGDIHNSKDIFIKAIGPNEVLKTAVRPEWFERHKIELGYWGEEVL